MVAIPIFDIKFLSVSYPDPGIVKAQLAEKAFDVFFVQLILQKGSNGFISMKLLISPEINL